jgi:CRISPR-associated protein Csd1
MSLLNNLIYAYDSCADMAGMDDVNKTLLPIGHMLLETDICITLNEKEGFVSADFSKEWVIAPCTVDSECSRTGNPCPNALFDQLCYLAYDYHKDKRRFQYYVDVLSSWSISNPKLEIVLTYIESKTIISDLNKELVRQKKTNKKIGEKDKVRFRVEVKDDLYPNLWTDTSIRELWTNHYLSIQDSKKQLCYLTGDLSSKIVDKHPKKIITESLNAKLISSNDNENFTWRGRYTNESQVLSISYEASQKLHHMLSWLISNIAFHCKAQKIMSWIVISHNDSKCFPKESPFHYFSESYENGTALKDYLTEDEIIALSSSSIYDSYADQIKKALSGYSGIKQEHITEINVLAIDSTSKSTGRLSITFYESLAEDEYLKSIADWQDTCCWFIPYKRKNGTVVHENSYFVFAPCTKDIISAIHGEEPQKASENYTRIAKYERVRLLNCVFRNKNLPYDMVNASVNNVSNPESYKDKNNNWDAKTWRKTLSVTCALVRKHIFNKESELYTMALDKTCTDRSYLWGRLLALAEDVESFARYKKDKSYTEKRPTNALRLMSDFRSHPYITWINLVDMINPYRIELDGAEGLQNQIDEVMSLFKPTDYTDNKQLDGKYLMGYSLQRIALRTKNKEDKTNELTKKD